MPTPKNREVQPIFSVPGTDGVTPVSEVLLGASEYCRSFQVMIGTIASSRLSTLAVANWIWPPYEPPTMPTRGSSGCATPAWSAASWTTTSGIAYGAPSFVAVPVPPRNEMSWDAARPSYAGSSSMILHPESGKPRPVYDSTAYPRWAKARPRPAWSALLPPKPLVVRIAGTRCVALADAGRYRSASTVHGVAPSGPVATVKVRSGTVVTVSSPLAADA